MFYALTTTLLILAGPPAPSEPNKEAVTTVVELQRSTICRGRRLRLRDVAQIRTTDRQLEGRLQDLDLGSPPLSGWVRNLSMQQVLAAVKDAGLSDKNILIAGAKIIEVQSRTALVTVNQIEEAAQLVLRSAVAALKQEEVRWSISTHGRAIRVQAGRIGVDLTAKVRKGRLERDRAIVDVAVRVDGETAATVPVIFRLNRFREVLVTLAPIPPGKPLDRGLVAKRRVDISRYFREPLNEMKAIQGKVSARNLPGGSILTLHDIKEPELVRRGEVVTMVAIRGRLKITMKGIARTGGSLGELVRVINPATRRVVTGRVAGIGVVTVNTRTGKAK